MAEECYRPEDLEAIADLPPDDPRLEHARTCPRCSGLLALYRKTADPSRLPPEARLSDARERLSRTLEQETAARRPGLIVRLWALRPVWGLVAVAALVLIVLQVGRSPEEPTVRPRRGGDDRSAAPVAEAPQSLTDGRVRLSWRPVADADSHQVVFFLPGLDELTRVGARDRTSLDLDLDRLPLSADRPDAIFWRIVAWRGGIEIAHSSMRTLPLRHSRQSQ